MERVWQEGEWAADRRGRRGKLREHLQALGGWNLLDVSGPARAAVGKVGPGHLVTRIRRTGSGRLAGIPQIAFLSTPGPSVFATEWFHDQISSRNVTRCAASLRLITRSSTLKVLKIPAGKHRLDFI